tara:strand:- start:880 stop:1734 length:855 start_codon:yes stop_codon:yes gene_type:complete
MRILLKTADLLVVSNLYVAAGTYSLTWITLQFYDCDRLELPFFVFFSTLFAYNFMRLVRVDSMLKEGYSIRHKSIYIYKYSLWFFTFLSALFALLFFIKIYEPIFYTVLILAIISISYSLPIYKKEESWFRLRDLPSVKIFLIASVWATVTVILPMQISVVSIDWLKVLERFLFVFAITIPFDIRDLRFDAEGLGTLPQIFGVNKARWIGISALLVAEGLLFYDYCSSEIYSIPSVLAIYTTYEIAVVLIYKSHPDLSERYFTIGVEGMSLLLGLLFYLSHILL